MSIYERIASAVVGTPLQHPAERLRWLCKLPGRVRHPELREVNLEEERAREVMERAIAKDTNCIDVGCHLGVYLTEILRLAPEGRHIAVEPIAYKAAWLRRKFPGVEIQEVALGEEEASVEFFRNTQTSGFSSLRAQGPGTSEALKVRCTRLDDIVPPGLPIGFIKIDVVGGEYRLFRGARRVLTESRPILLFECTRSCTAAFGVKPSEVFSTLVDELGYRIFLMKDWLDGGPPLDVARFESAMIYPFEAFNFVGAPAPQAGA
jgi:FkbM family methyltransferase